jgi:hypothetical protein
VEGVVEKMTEEGVGDVRFMMMTGEVVVLLASV